MNVLLVGLGRWGENHLRVLRQLGATVWLADVAASRREWAIGQGVERGRVVGDFRQALSHVAAVDIVTPAHSHRDVAETCLQAGRHCFIEKPLAVSVEDGRAVASAARAAGRVVQVGHIFRFHPVTATLLAALTGDRIGGVRYASARFSGFKRPRMDVGVTHTDAIHYFDLFAYLLGCGATRVSALQRDYLGRGLDDMSLTTVWYGEVPVVVEANYFVPGTHRECVIVGERGALVADYGASTVSVHTGEHRRRGGVWEALDGGKEDVPAHGEEPLRLELEAFVAACEGRQPTPVPAEAGVHALEVVEAAASAARLDRVVELKELR
jgi:predicted dehydrogenase